MLVRPLLVNGLFKTRASSDENLAQEIKIVIDFFAMYEFIRWVDKFALLKKLTNGNDAESALVKLVIQVKNLANDITPLNSSNETFRECLNQFKNTINKFSVQLKQDNSYNENSKNAFKDILKLLEKVREIIGTDLCGYVVEPEISSFLINPQTCKKYSNENYDLFLRIVSAFCKLGATSALNIIFKKYPHLVNVDLSVTNGHAACDGPSFLDCSILSFQCDSINVLLNHGANVNKTKESSEHGSDLATPLLAALVYLVAPEMPDVAYQFRHLSLLTHEDGLMLLSRNLPILDLIIQQLLEAKSNPDLVCFGDNDYAPREFCKNTFGKVNVERQRILQRVIDYQLVEQPKPPCSRAY